MRRRVQLLGAFPLVAALAAVACMRPTLEGTLPERSDGSGHLITSVPFLPQESYQCGPAALAMVMQYYGAEVGQEEIATEVVRPSIRGTLNLELEFYARRRGFHARSFVGTLERLRGEIRRNRPLVVLQDLGVGPYAVPHFAVVVGFDDRTETVVLHSGTTPYLIVPYREFERSWAKRRAWTLLVTPADES